MSGTGSGISGPGTGVSDEARRMRDQTASSASRVGKTAGDEAKKVGDQASSSAERLTESASDELARLRDQVERLMSDKVTPALSRAADQVQGYAEDARETIEHQADALSDTIRERPLLAIGIAAVSGYLIGRLIGGNTYVYSRGH